ncbi:MAG: 3-deoxy-8-phosphooctulonate synthase [Desulfomonilaceae bacterium]|jgi:2-dehydro-3-deoxyphosphooctonate aldolase (KDO 8-P synthase)
MTFLSSFREEPIGGFDLSDRESLFFIVGPCVIETWEITFQVANEVARISRTHGIPMIFKSSFDKANRTSVDSFRGPGIEKGLEILSEVRSATGLPIVSDVHSPEQAEQASEVLDVLQIPAFLSRQTDLLVAAGRTKKAVNIKKGQFQAPQDMEHAVKKVMSTGNAKILLTERGTSFGYRDLVADMRSISWMKSFGFPIVFDATHSSQFPGAGSGKSGGDRTLAPSLSRAAVGAGANGVFIETHPDPDRALCDGPNSLALSDLESLVLNLVEIHKLIPRSEPGSSSFGLQNQALGPVLAPDLQDRFKLIKLIIFDVDGVLTDGKIVFAGNDLEIKSFHVRDGHGIKLAMRSGLDVALVTGRKSDVVRRRADDLGIERVFQGIWDKRPVFKQLVSELNLKSEEVAVIGDDVVDIPMMRLAGLAATTPEAPVEVRKEAHYVTSHAGGYGAARELIEMILKAQDKWRLVMARYYE